MAMHGGEAASGVIYGDTYGAKLHGSQLPSDYGRDSVNPSSAMKTIKKRGLKRAFRRMDKLAHTWYEGQLWTKPQQCTSVGFDQTYYDSPDSTPPQTAQPREHVPRGRLQIFHWNAGALSQSKYHEVLHWCSLNWIDIVVLTETHWTFEDEWTTEHYHLIHSGTSTPAAFDRSSGILIAISKKLCDAYQLAWTSLMSGRLLHCRIHCHPRPIDIVGLYQYVWNGSVLQSQRRKQLWDLTYTTVDALAKRNSLCLLGDFNCSLDVIPRLVGTNHYTDLAGVRMQGPQHGDKLQFKKLVQDLNLVGLNTWNSNQGPTFINTLGRSSKIDFIFTRMFHADRLAKNVGHLYDAPFLQDRPHHIPLLASLGHRMCRPTRRCLALFPTNVKNRCINDFRDDTLMWQGCMHDVNAQLRHTPVESLEQLTEILNNGILTTYSTPKINPSSMTQAQGFLKQKWYHFRQARVFAYTTLKTVFQKWHHMVCFKILDKAHSQQVKLHRRSKLDEMMQEANEAHSNHDSYKLYRIVQKHCPKQRVKRIRLKNAQGDFLTHVEETAEYCRYIADKWSGPQMVIPQMNPPGLPFTVDELEIAISNIPGAKAVAPLFAPGVAWKSQANFLSPWIYSRLKIWWTTSPPFIPQAWRDGWVAFLPKPNKAATKFENLRILALQEPIGKCIIQLLTKKSSQQSYAALVKHPQFAYLPLRSTRDALLRVAEHCDAVRRLLQSQASTIHIPRQSQPRLKCCGGIQIFLDLHRAFDQLPRPLIVQALERMPLSSSLFSLLTHWHQRYKISHSSK